MPSSLVLNGFYPALAIREGQAVMRSRGHKALENASQSQRTNWLKAAVVQGVVRAAVSKLLEHWHNLF